MKNDYEVRGPVTAIFCTATPKAGGGIIETVISTAKLEKAKTWPGTWFPYTDKEGDILIKGHKVVTNVEGYMSQQPYLHRILADTPPGFKAIHKDGNTLNNTDENLVNVRLGQKYDDAPVQPERGVHWRQDKKKYEVAAYYDGRKYHLGLWEKDKLKEANKAVTEFRQLGPRDYFRKYPKKGGS